MNKQLFTERSSPLSFRLKTLSEEILSEVDRTGMMLVKNIPSTILNEKNQNGRIYKTEEFSKALSTAKKNGLFEGRTMLCTADDHPEGTYPKPSTCSHIVVDARIKKVEGKDVLFNDWLILNTEQGKNLRALIEAGASIGTSIRGLGTQNESTGEIDQYEYLGTDVVGNPSAGTFASFEGLSESIIVEAVSPALVESIQESLSNKGVVENKDTKALIKNLDKVGDNLDSAYDILKKSISLIPKSSFDIIGDGSKSSNSGRGVALLKDFINKLEDLQHSISDLANDIDDTMIESQRKLSTNIKSNEEITTMFNLSEALDQFQEEYVSESELSISGISALLKLEQKVLEEGADLEVFKAFKTSVLGKVPSLPVSESQDEVKDSKVEQAKSEDVINKADRHLEASKLVVPQLREQCEELLAENESLKKFKESSSKLTQVLVERTKKALESAQAKEASIDAEQKRIAEEIKSLAVGVIEQVQTEAKEAILQLEAKLESTIRIGDIIGNHFFAARAINKALQERLLSYVKSDSSIKENAHKSEEIVVQTKESTLVESNKAKNGDPISGMEKNGWV